MADGSRSPESTPPGAPRWVKIGAVVAAVLVVAIVVVALLSGGEHGPGQHLPGGDNSGSHTPPVEHSS